MHKFIKYAFLNQWNIKMTKKVSKDEALKAVKIITKEISESSLEQEALEAVKTLILWAGDDPEREGLVDTPKRVVKAYKEFFAGYDEDPEEILNLCNIIVAIRPGFTPSDIPQWVLDNVRFANIPRFEVSSTNIRRRWREGKTIRYMVPKEVWEYINEKELY